jgi:hypothetical protein
MRFLYAAVLTFAAGSNVAMAQSSDAIDLAGEWTFEILRGDATSRLGVVTIVQDGAQVAASWKALSDDMLQTFGYTQGDTAFEGEVRDNSLTGRLRLHYPVENRETCPDSWQTWERLEVALPVAPLRLQGRFRNSAISERDCSIEQRGWLFFTLTRLSPETGDEPSRGPLRAGVLAEGSFDAGSEGWLEDTGGSVEATPAPHIPQGGNPGGYLGFTSAAADGAVWEAPVQFLGDLKAAVGGELLLDILPGKASEPGHFDVVLEGSGESISRRVVLATSADWQTHSLRLAADADWQAASSGKPASEADLRRLLGFLERLRIETSGISGLDNVVLSSEVSPKAPVEEVTDTTPARVSIDLLDRSAVAGKAMNLNVGLVNDANQRVPADKEISVDLSAEGAEVRPSRVSIPQGSSGAGARLYGETPGSVEVRGTAAVAELQSGAATGFICAQGRIARINFGASAQEAAIGESIHITLDLVNDTGTLVTDDGQRKRLNVVIEGVGRSLQGDLGWIDQGRCTTEAELLSDRPGESPVSVSLGTIGPEQRTFRFYLDLDATVLLAVILGGICGAFARAASVWKRAQRWKVKRWCVELCAATISGLAVFLVYHFGLLKTLPQLSGGLGLVFLLSLVGGYLGPTALDRIADRILPAGKSKA